MQIFCEKKKKKLWLRLTKAFSVEVKSNRCFVSVRFASAALTSCSNVVSTHAAITIDEDFTAISVSQIFKAF